MTHTTQVATRLPSTNLFDNRLGVTLESSAQVVTNGESPFVSAGMVVHTHVGPSEYPRWDSRVAMWVVCCAVTHHHLLRTCARDNRILKCGFFRQSVISLHNQMHSYWFEPLGVAHDAGLSQRHGASTGGSTQAQRDAPRDADSRKFEH